MKRKLACRRLKLWPNVIADIIGGYAEYMTEEKVWILVGPQASRKANGVVLERSGCIKITWPGGYLSDYGLMDIYRDPTRAICISVGTLARSIDDREWPWPFGSMTEPEKRAFDEWLASVD